jgi:hypothetical protein
MEVIVSVLIYVLVGLDGKANTAEDVSENKNIKKMRNKTLVSNLVHTTHF